MKKVIATLSDITYYHKAKRTILDLRSRGKWDGDLVLITVGFKANNNFCDFYNVTEYCVNHINTEYLLSEYNKCPISPTCDNREYMKLTQWDKFYIFSDYFKKWDCVLFVDAGMRILDEVKYLLDLDCKDSIMAPDDAPYYDTKKRFGGIIETNKNIPVVTELFKEYSPKILNERYFLNCIWMYDTSLLNKVSFSDLIETMNKYPICRCNEMTIMNLLFTFKHKVWKPFPEFIQNSRKRLFGWCENDRNYGSDKTWRDFCFIKYSFTLNFECE
jgi:hypothetical protein